MTTKKMLKENRYCGYFPVRIMAKLTTVSSIKIMFYIFMRCNMNRNINAIQIHQKDIPGLSRVSFYNGLKNLEDGLWICVDRSNCHCYDVTLNPNYNFTKSELNYLEGKGRRQ